MGQKTTTIDMSDTTLFYLNRIQYLTGYTMKRIVSDGILLVHEKMERKKSKKERKERKEQQAALAVGREGLSPKELAGKGKL